MKLYSLIFLAVISLFLINSAHASEARTAAETASDLIDKHFDAKPLATHPLQAAPSTPADLEPFPSSGSGY